MSEIKNRDQEKDLSVPKNAEVEKLPEVSGNIELAMTDTVSCVDDVVFSALKGIRRYQIVRAPKEKLDRWKRGVDEFINAITARNLSQVRKLMDKDDRSTGDVDNADNIERLISEEVLEDTDIKLLAIGLFVLREKSPWNPKKAGLKVLKGGKTRMESAFEPEGWANCYDIAAIVLELAKMYGIAGKLHGKGFSHAYFETEDGKVSDPMYGWKRGGLFQTKEKFETYKKEMGLLRRMGIKG